MEVVPLHKHLEYTDECVKILNSYWPRSKAAREHSLTQSCDQMPVSLVFIKKPSEVIGYSRLSAVQGRENSCLIESVIIDESLRGKGLGRILMNLTEDFAKSKFGVQTAYLNTLDQEGFYTKLGYVRCKPVISLGANANRVPKDMLQKLLGCSMDDGVDIGCSMDDGVDRKKSIESSKNGIKENSSSLKVSFAHKATVNQRSSGPPPPPPPPPPPCPAAKQERSNDRAVLRLNPDEVAWMKKDL